jgi:hypothetical protein
MKYISTPIMLSENWMIEGEPVDADGELLCHWQADHDAKLEMVQAVNEHDELVAQRDALVDACEASRALSQHLAVCDSFDEPDGDCPTCLELGQRMRDTRRSALALVRGDAQ